MALPLNQFSKLNLMNEQNQQALPEDNSPERFESDAKKLADRHMADPNHVITEEDLRNIRVGMAPPPDEPTQQAIADGSDRIADREANSEDDTLPGAQKMTPWDLTT